MAPSVIPFLINGEERNPKETFEVISPDTGDVLHLCGVASKTEATEAVEAAAAAGDSWRETSPGTRRDIFFKAAEIMESKRDELAKCFADELGHGGGWAQFNIDTSIDMFKDVAGRVSSLVGTVPHVADPNTSAVVWREPYGVVLAIAPWNASFILGTRSLLYPLAAGCTVVHKGSERSPKSMYSIVSILHEAGLPKGALNFVTSNPANAAAMTEGIIANPLVRKVNFTGSTAIGRRIAEMAGRHLKPLVLELGGKAPAIVWHDADLDLAAVQCSLGAFHASGQICMCTEKIIVHKSISEQFTTKLQQKVSQMFPGALVPINAEAVEKNKKLVADATSRGATIIHGDLDTTETTKTRMRPIVVGKVTSEMDIYHQESFGPTVSLIEVDSEEEALRIANDTEYGLSSAVFTEDLRTGLRFAKKIESGAVHINNMTIHDEMALPHGGTKASGYGRFGSSNGLDEYLKTKTVTWKN